MTSAIKEGLFEEYIDDLRYLGTSIPMLYWHFDGDGDIRLEWHKINDELSEHLQYSEDYIDKLNKVISYFNYSHKITDEDL
jgi:hypothetical protein